MILSLHITPHRRWMIILFCLLSVSVVLYIFQIKTSSGEFFEVVGYLGSGTICLNGTPCHKAPNSQASADTRTCDLPKRFLIIGETAPLPPGLRSDHISTLGTGF